MEDGEAQSPPSPGQVEGGLPAGTPDATSPSAAADDAASGAPSRPSASPQNADDRTSPNNDEDSAHDGESDEEKPAEGEEVEEDHHDHETVGIASNEVKNVILQVLSPYFEDDGTEGGDEEDTAQRYDHLKCKTWVQLICDGIQERLLAFGKPYKYVAHCVIMRKSGAGMHVCSSCYYGAADGWVSHAHDLSAHIYAVVTVYWCAV